MNNNIITDTHYYESTSDEAIKILRLYVIIRIIFMIIMFIIGIIICIALFDIAKELQHFTFHLTDGTCCSMHF